MAAGWSVMDALNRNSKAVARISAGKVPHKGHQPQEDVQQ